MSTDEKNHLTPSQLAALVPPNACDCTCTVGACAGWESVTDERWPKSKMTCVCTLRQPLQEGEMEPTYEEFHPQGTRYESVNAPIAVLFFPFNRCDVYQCGPCQRVLLKYTEYGGYYIDHRVRAMNPDLIVETETD